MVVGVAVGVSVIGVPGVGVTGVGVTRIGVATVDVTVGVKPSIGAAGGAARTTRALETGNRTRTRIAIHLARFGLDTETSSQVCLPLPPDEGQVETIE
jgi:hypothetical protein